MTSPEAACLGCGATRSELWAHARDEEYHTSREVFGFRRCHECGVLFIDPVPRDRLAEIYPPSYYSFSGPGNSLVQRIKSRLDRRVFASLLDQLEGPGLNALDVGGGVGWELTLVRSLDPRIRRTQVVDFDADAGERARAAGHEYFRGRIEDFETEERFDLVLLLNLIEHVEDPRAVLGKVQKLLSPQGLALVKTPNYDSLDGRIFRHRNWGGYHCPRHWVLFTRESFGAAAAGAGLAVREFRYTQGAPFWATSLLFLLRRRKLVRIDPARPAYRHPAYGPLTGLFAALDFARAPAAKLSQMFFVLARADAEPYSKGANAASTSSMSTSRK